MTSDHVQLLQQALNLLRDYTREEIKDSTTIIEFASLTRELELAIEAIKRDNGL